jgi:hypothetical protein
MNTQDVKKGYSLLIGLNQVNPDHYEGWNGTLSCCEKDVSSMATILAKEGYTNIDTLLTKNATRENVSNALQKAAGLVDSGDVFLLYYSGHGAYLKDEHNEEDDKQDETWCLYNGQMLDDEIYSHWDKFKKDVKILMISDSCHSGTISKAISENAYNIPKSMPRDLQKLVYKKHKDFYQPLRDQKRERNKNSQDIQATVLLLSACQDNQQAMAGSQNSLFTRTLIELYGDPSISGNYKDYYLHVKEKISRIQTPNYFVLGVKNEAFEAQKPFRIS